MCKENCKKCTLKANRITESDKVIKGLLNRLAFLETRIQELEKKLQIRPPKHDIFAWSRVMGYSAAWFCELGVDLDTDERKVCQPVISEMNNIGKSSEFKDDVCRFLADELKLIHEGTEPFMPLNQLIEICKVLTK